MGEAQPYSKPTLADAFGSGGSGTSMSDAKPHSKIGSFVRGARRRVRSNLILGVFVGGVMAISGVGLPLAVAWGAGFIASMAVVDAAEGPLGRGLLRARLGFAKSHTGRGRPARGDVDKRTAVLTAGSLAAMWVGIALTCSGVLAPVGLGIVAAAWATGTGGIAYRRASRQYFSQAPVSTGPHWTPAAAGSTRPVERVVEITGRSVERPTPSLSIPPVSRQQPPRQLDR